MGMQNLRLLGINQIDGNIDSVTSEAADYPAAYLAISRPSWRWRSTDLTDQVIEWSLAESVGANMFAIVNDNLTTDSTIHLELATDVGFTDVVYDEIFAGRLPYYGWGEMWYGSIDWGGAGDWPAGLLPILTHIFVEPVAYQYGRITISDSGNPEGYIEAGRLIVGSSWQPGDNMDWGATHDIEFDSDYTYTPAGAAIAEPSAPRRVIDVSFSWLDAIEDKDLMRHIEFFGRNKAVLLSCCPGEGGALEQTYTIYGPLVSWSGSSHHNLRLNARQFRVSQTW